MINRFVIAGLILAGVAFSTGAPAAATDPCVSTPDTSATGGLADPGPCKIATSTKGSKNAKSSNNAKGASNGKGSGNGNGNGNGNAGDNGQGAGPDESEIQQGLAIAPVPLDLQGRNRALVARGSYIVNAQGGCNDCHTWPNFAPNGDPYRGQPKAINATHYLAGGRPFGPFVSRNLTPDPSSTATEEERYAEFVRVMRTGWDPDQLHAPISPLLQVMPWPAYQDMTDRDLKAIFEYLQAIPHAEPYCDAAHAGEAICQP